MAKTVADNFLYKGKKPLDEREQFTTVLSMKEFPEQYIPEGFLTYCLEDKKTYRFSSTNPVSATTGKWKEETISEIYDGYYTRIDPLTTYGYEIYYENLNYPYAYKKFEENLVPSGCSSVRSGNFYGRNLDWIYNEDAEFIIHTPSAGGRYATLGTCGQMSKMSDAFVKSGDYASEYVLLPFYCVDGINEKGVFINVNVVPAEAGNTLQFIEPTEDVRVEICANMIPRYVLDYCGSADEAVDFIKKHMRVYFSRKLQLMGYEPHFMLGDETKTYIVEFVNNAVSIIDCADRPYMTNFHLTGITFNGADEPPVYTPEYRGADGTKKPSDNGITPHGAGLERYNLISDGLKNDVPVDMIMRGGLAYTRTYMPDTTPYWYSELVGIDGTTVDSPVSAFTAPGGPAERAQARFNRRSRNPEQEADYGTWQTTHSIVYDIAARTANVVFQEDVSQSFDVELKTGVDVDKTLIYHNNWEMSMIFSRLALTSPAGYPIVEYAQLKEGDCLSFVATDDLGTVREIMIDDGISIGIATGEVEIKKGQRYIFYYAATSTGSKFWHEVKNTESLVHPNDWTVSYNDTVLVLTTKSEYQPHPERPTEGDYVTFVAKEATAEGQTLNAVIIDNGGIQAMMSPTSLKIAKNERVELYYHITYNPGGEITSAGWYQIKGAGITPLDLAKEDLLKDIDDGTFDITVDGEAKGVYIHHNGNSALAASDGFYTTPDLIKGDMPDVPDFTYKLDVNKLDVDEDGDIILEFNDETGLNDTHLKIVTESGEEVIDEVVWDREITISKEEAGAYLYVTIVDPQGNSIEIKENSAIARAAIELYFSTDLYHTMSKDRRDIGPYRAARYCNGLQKVYFNEEFDVVAGDIFDNVAKPEVSTVVMFGSDGIYALRDGSFKSLPNLRELIITTRFDNSMDFYPGLNDNFGNTDWVTKYNPEIVHPDEIEEIAYGWSRPGSKFMPLNLDVDATVQILLNSPIGGGDSDKSFVTRANWDVVVSADKTTVHLTSPTGIVNPATLTNNDYVSFIANTSSDNATQVVIDETTYSAERLRFVVGERVEMFYAGGKFHQIHNGVRRLTGNMSAIVLEDLDTGIYRWDDAALLLKDNFTYIFTMFGCVVTGTLTTDGHTTLESIVPYTSGIPDLNSMVERIDWVVTFPNATTIGLGNPADKSFYQIVKEDCKVTFVATDNKTGITQMSVGGSTKPFDEPVDLEKDQMYQAYYHGGKWHLVTAKDTEEPELARLYERTPRADLTLNETVTDVFDTYISAYDEQGKLYVLIAFPNDDERYYITVIDSPNDYFTVDGNPHYIHTSGTNRLTPQYAKIRGMDIIDGRIFLSGALWISGNNAGSCTYVGEISDLEADFVRVTTGMWETFGVRKIGSSYCTYGSCRDPRYKMAYGRITYDAEGGQWIKDAVKIGQHGVSTTNIVDVTAYNMNGVDMGHTPLVLTVAKHEDGNASIYYAPQAEMYNEESCYWVEDPDGEYVGSCDNNLYFYMIYKKDNNLNIYRYFKTWRFSSEWRCTSYTVPFPASCEEFINFQATSDRVMTIGKTTDPYGNPMWQIYSIEGDKVKNYDIVVDDIARFEDGHPTAFVCGQAGDMIVVGPRFFAYTLPLLPAPMSMPTKSKDVYGAISELYAKTSGGFDSVSYSTDTRLVELPKGQHKLDVDGEFAGILSVEDDAAYLIGRNGTMSAGMTIPVTDGPLVQSTIVVPEDMAGEYFYAPCKGEQIDWGDGYGFQDMDDHEHRYETPGTYQISVRNGFDYDVDATLRWNNLSYFCAPLTNYACVFRISETVVPFIGFLDPMEVPNYRYEVYDLTDFEPRTVVMPACRPNGTPIEPSSTKIVFVNAFNTFRFVSGEMHPIEIVFPGNLPYLADCFNHRDTDFPVTIYLEDANFDEYKQQLQAMCPTTEAYENEVYTFKRLSEWGHSIEDFYKYHDNRWALLEDIIATDNVATELHKILQKLTTGSGV